VFINHKRQTYMLRGSRSDAELIGVWSRAIQYGSIVCISRTFVSVRGKGNSS